MFIADTCIMCGYHPEGPEAETIVFWLTNFNRDGPYCTNCIGEAQEQDDEINGQFGVGA